VIFLYERATSDKVTNTLFMFIERHRSAVQLCLMAVIKKAEEVKKWKKKF